MWQPLFASLAFVGCALADIPETYHGRVGRTILAVPSAIAGSVLYDGETDWAAPEKPKSNRTDQDVIKSIQFFVDLDQPGHIITDQAARERLVERGAVLHLPAVFGHVLGITVNFGTETQKSAVAIRAQFNSYSFAPAFRALQRAPSEYGLETRRADWSKPVKGREHHGIGMFDVDVDYLSEAENIYIYCNDARQHVAPFAPMPTCQFKIVVPEFEGVISGVIDRGDVSNWRNLRASALATLHSFVAASAVPVKY